MKLSLSDQLNFMTPLEVALYAASLRLHVFPANPTNKRPLISAWNENCTIEEDKIRKFWSDFPEAMVAVVTGVKSNCFVVDVDVEEGEDAEQLFQTFAHNIGGLPETFTVRTPSGGLHKYFLMPAGFDLRNSAKKLGKGIDIRANGGYVIFAGSVRTDGKAYQVEGGI